MTEIAKRFIEWPKTRRQIQHSYKYRCEMCIFIRIYREIVVYLGTTIVRSLVITLHVNYCQTLAEFEDNELTERSSCRIHVCWWQILWSQATLQTPTTDNKHKHEK